MKSFRQPFREPTIAFAVRLPPDLARWIEEEARARRVTRTKIVHDHLRAQQELHKQLAESFTLGPHDARASGKQLLHTLLTQLKEELAQSIDAQTEQIAVLVKQLTTAQAMLDRAYYGFLLHTDTVPEDQRPQRRLDAQRRYERWIEDVRQLLGGHHGAADLAAATADPHPGKTPP